LNGKNAIPNAGCSSQNAGSLVPNAGNIQNPGIFSNVRN
jgi:hypothetical protein